MAIKAGQILHDANGFVVDRIQTGGVGNLNIPEEKIYELGNYRTVATVRDIPDLSFDLESLDVSTEIESLALFRNPTTVVAGDEFDFADAVPLDVISPFKSAQGQYDIVRGIAVPYLTLENVTYRFGTRQNATQQFTFRGDSVFYVSGTPYYQQYAANGILDTFAFAHTALPYDDQGDTVYALGVCVVFADGTYERQYEGDDYTSTAANVVFVDPPPAGSTVRVVYGSAVSADYLQTVHQGVSVKPAAVRGKDIDVFVGAAGEVDTDTYTRWTSVQGFEVSRRVNIENDEEFGNPRYVASEYDTADVTGSITVKPRNPADLWDKVHEIADVPSGEIVGPNSSIGLPVELRIHDPETGARVKTLYVPDARFTLPGVQGRVQQKAEVTFNFTSDEGQLLVYAGARP